MIWGTTTVAWAMLNKIFTPGFYNYMKDPAHFLSTPAMTGDAYEDMHSALVANNVCTGWQPLHRIQFAHSKGDMIVPYGNYLAFCEAHPDGEDDWYHIDNTFSDQDHLSAGTAFVMSLGTKFFDYFQWIDAAPPPQTSRQFMVYRSLLKQSVALRGLFTVLCTTSKVVSCKASRHKKAYIS